MDTYFALNINTNGTTSSNKHYPPDSPVFVGQQYHWPFDEGSGNTVIDVISGANGTMNNAVRVPGGVTGDNAIQINGSDQSNIVLPAAVGAFGTSDFTVQFWVKTSDNSIPYYDLAGNRTASSHGNFLSIRMTGNHPTISSGTIVAEVDQDGNGTNYIAVQSSNGGYNDGKWHQVTVIRQGNGLILFIDTYNVGKGSAAAAANINNNNPFIIGKSVSMGGRFAPNAMYDDVWISFSVV